MTRRRSTTLIFTVLAVAAASFSMLQSLLNPALPLIQAELHTTQTATTWILTAWALASAASTPLVGRMGDLYGKKRMLLAALSAIVLGSALAALAPSIGVLIAGRVLQGLGGAVFPLAYGIIRETFPAAKVGGAIGIMSSVMAVGGGLGSVLAGPIAELLGWRGLFWAPMIVVAFVGILMAVFLSESEHRPGGRIRPLGAVLLAAWLVALLLPLSSGSRWGWTSPLTIGLLVVAAVLIALWIRVEASSPTPIVDMRMMRLPAVWTTNLVAFLFGAGMFATITFVPQFVQAPASLGYGFGATMTVAGLVILPMTITMAVVGGFSGRISRVMPYRLQLIIASALSAIAALGYTLEHTAIWQIAAAGAISGLGLGLAYAALTNLIVQAVPAHQTGVATGMNTNIRTIGGALGTAIFGAILSASTTAGAPSAAGYTTAFIFLTGLGVLATLASLLIPVPRRVAAQEQAEEVIEAAELLLNDAEQEESAAGITLPLRPRL